MEVDPSFKLFMRKNLLLFLLSLKNSSSGVSVLCLDPLWHFSKCNTNSLKDKLRRRPSCFAENEEFNCTWKRFAEQPTRSEYFWCLTSLARVILLSSQANLRKNALFIDQSAFSNFALYVVSLENNQRKQN